MALKFAIQFPIFAPPNNPSPLRPPTEIRFSRWNNANAEPFNIKRRAQQQIEDDIRRERRFDSADNIATISQSAGTNITTTSETFKSTGTPSYPSRPSIPGKSSKYSKIPNSHPAFSSKKKTKIIRNRTDVSEETGKPIVAVSEDGVSFKVEGAPFEMMYSYTETPKVKPLALREPPFSPFGPPSMGRPWTGKAPIPASTKKLKEFDSFVLPPPHKKGVKPVQKPGPFLPGSGPKYVKSREEILGEPLKDEEIKALVQSCLKTQRQLNMGRDGLTHNMLDNIHAHWKRRRVCKIKCKGVCTVDMANVREQLEEKTGGKIIYSRGGVLFLFRGRNYNYKTRPRYPIMLWKPVTPVYPRLIKQAPEGLTVEEARIMRKKGRNLIPICKLAKNGVYSDLVRNVREAFEACELVRINCQGLNGSDYRRIGAKLKDLVPCVLISFELEHVLMWRGTEWKSSFHDPEDPSKESKKYDTDDVSSNLPSLEELEASDNQTSIDDRNTSTPFIDLEDASEEIRNDMLQVEDPESESISESSNSAYESENMSGPTFDHPVIESSESDTLEETNSQDITLPCTGKIQQLLNQAIESGSALILEDAPLDDDDLVYKRVVSFSQSAPPGPVFKRYPHRVMVQTWKKEENAKQVMIVPERREEEERENVQLKVFEAVVAEKRNREKKKKKSSKASKNNNFKVDYPKGSLGVDEIAKLLA